jgi:hypothetical protein
MNNVDKKYLWAAVIIVGLFTGYTFWGPYIESHIKDFLNKEQWVNWITAGCLMLEVFHKWKYERVKLKGDNLIDFIKECKDWIGVIAEPGVLICAIHLLRGSFLYIIFNDRGFFPRFNLTIVIFIAAVSLFTLIHSILKLHKHFFEVFRNSKSRAEVSADDALPDE